jgi:hypothetical protein
MQGKESEKVCYSLERPKPFYTQKKSARGKRQTHPTT